MERMPVANSQIISVFMFFSINTSVNLLKLQLTKSKISALHSIILLLCLGRAVEYCDKSVCLSVCLRGYSQQCSSDQSYQIFVRWTKPLSIAWSSPGCVVTCYVLLGPCGGSGAQVSKLITCLMHPWFSCWFWCYVLFGCLLTSPTCLLFCVLFFFLFTFSTCLLPSRIVPLHFQAAGRTRWPNLVLGWFILSYCSVLKSLPRPELPVAMGRGMRIAKFA